MFNSTRIQIPKLWKSKQKEFLKNIQNFLNIHKLKLKDFNLGKLVPYGYWITLVETPIPPPPLSLVICQNIDLTKPYLERCFKSEAIKKEVLLF